MIAWGGDGTVNGAASGVAGTGIPFAIIPGGSGNGLARDLSIPFDPAAAFDDRRDRDDARRSMPAICTARCSSTSPALASTRASPIAWRQPGARRGLIGYVLATVERAARLSSPGAIRFDNAFDVDGKALIADIIDRPALFIALANSRQYGSGAQIAPRRCSTTA